MKKGFKFPPDYRPANKGEGRGLKWLRQHVSYQSEDCLPWPFGRNNETGYGTLGHECQIYYAHRMMCELVHGPAPSPGHYATHDCGKGHEGCVNPKHIAWKNAGRERSGSGKAWQQ